MRTLVALGLALALGGCGGGTETVGPCVIRQEPLVTLTSQDAPVLRVTRVRIDGQQVRPADLAMSARGDGVSVQGRILACEVPCRFGSQPGEWELRVAAPGHRSVAVRRAAEYAESSGGCPGHLGGGPVIDVDLAPRP